MGHVLRRPTFTVAPGFALKLPLRDFAEDLLGGQRGVPRRLLDAGFTFDYPSFEPALRAVLAKTE
jgi:NAD dependent epimerase/dehydratase family enzyme